MAFDIAFVVILAVYVIIGLFQRLIKQFFRLLGLIALFIYLRFFCIDAANYLFARTHLSEPSSLLTAFILGSIVILLVFALLGMVAGWICNFFTRPKVSKSDSEDNETRKAPPAPRRHTFLGALFGLARGLVFALLLFCLLDLIPVRLLRDYPDVSANLRQSFVLRTVSPVNPFADYKCLFNLASYSDVLRKDQIQAAMQTQKPIIELQKNDNVRAAMNDPAVRECINQKQFLKLLDLPSIRKCLADPQVITLLRQINPQLVLDAPKPPAP